MDLAWYVRGLTPAQKAVLVALADHASHEGKQVFPSVGRIAIKTSYSQRTVRRALATLREMSLIIVERNSTFRQPTEYRINLTQMQALQARPDNQSRHELPHNPTDLPETTTRPVRDASKLSLTHHKSSQVNQAVAISAFYDSHTRAAAGLYSQITGQVSIPSNIADGVLVDLGNILDQYHNETGPAIETGKRHFQKWCSTRGKTGKMYSRTNPGWINWWLNELAPQPQAIDLEIPKPTAMCGQGQRYYHRATNMPARGNLQEYNNHISGCRICGQSITSKQVQAQIKQLTERMGAE